MYHDKAEDGSGVSSADNGEENKEEEDGEESGSSANEHDEEKYDSNDEESGGFVKVGEASAKTVIRLKKWLVFPTYQPDHSVLVRGFEGDSKVCLMLCVMSLSLIDV